MASSSGNSSGSGSSNQLQNSGSEGDLQQVMDQRKRKRMLSNRESARRSRMRKQKHLDDLLAQVGELRKENSQILDDINTANQHFLTVEAENSILRVQMLELSQRLQSLNDILSYMNNNNINNNGGMFEIDHHQDLDHINPDSFINPWNLLYVNQPITASADQVFQY